jgi:AraC-like DNA-binding protein
MTPEAFDDPDGAIDDAARRALWTAAYRMTKDPDLALHVPEGRRFAESDGLAATAPTVGAAFERQCTYWCWFDDSSALSIVREDEIVGLAIGMSDGSSASRVRAQYGFADLYLGVRSATRVDFAPLRLDFSTPPPSDTTELRRLFRDCELRFNQPRDCMWFSDADWLREVQHRRCDLIKMLELRTGALRSSFEHVGPTAQEVRRIMAVGLGSTPPLQLYDVAKKVGMSPRTLQRRLNDEGMSFGELLDGVRRACAYQLLRDRTHSLAAIAYLLGFSEQSAFTRAFKRWTGMTPIQFRRDAYMPSSDPVRPRRLRPRAPPEDRPSL